MIQLDEREQAIIDEMMEKLRQHKAETPSVYSVKRLSLRWDCSEKQIRRLIASGELPAFSPGGKLWRIRGEDVEAYEQCRTIGSGGSTGASASPGTTTLANGTVTRLGPTTRAKLNGLRRRSTQN